MISHEDPSPEAIDLALARLAAQVKAAFADVTLDGGIGYYEADAIDGYTARSHPTYQQAIEKDRTTTWLELAEQLQSGYCGIATNFMDAQGLHYFLPIPLLLCPANDLDLPDDLFMPWGQKRALEMLALLTPIQWEALLDFYVFHVDLEGWVDYWRSADPGSLGEACPSCGRIHGCSRREPRTALSRAEAEAKVEAETKCQIWRQLQAAYRQAYPEQAEDYLNSPRAKSRQYLFEVGTQVE